MEFETLYVHLRIKDEILVGTYKKGLSINLAVAEEIVRNRIAFTGGKKMPALIFSEGVLHMDKPAREFLASAAGTEGLSAAAIILNSVFSSMMGRLFLKINKTPLPVKTFNSVPKAEKWLQQFIIESSKKEEWINDSRK